MGKYLGTMEGGNKRHYYEKPNFKKNRPGRTFRVKNLEHIMTNNEDLEYQCFISIWCKHFQRQK